MRRLIYLSDPKGIDPLPNASDNDVYSRKARVAATRFEDKGDMSSFIATDQRPVQHIIDRSFGKGLPKHIGLGDFPVSRARSRDPRQ